MRVLDAAASVLLFPAFMLAGAITALVSAVVMLAVAATAVLWA